MHNELVECQITINKIKESEKRIFSNISEPIDKDLFFSFQYEYKENVSFLETNINRFRAVKIESDEIASHQIILEDLELELKKSNMVLSFLENGFVKASFL